MVRCSSATLLLPQFAGTGTADGGSTSWWNEQRGVQQMRASQMRGFFLHPARVEGLQTGDRKEKVVHRFIGA